MHRDVLHRKFVDDWNECACVSGAWMIIILVYPECCSVQCSCSALCVGDTASIQALSQPAIHYQGACSVN